jgi:hypothetical protein
MTASGRRAAAGPQSHNVTGLNTGFGGAGTPLSQWRESSGAERSAVIAVGNSTISSASAARDCRAGRDNYAVVLPYAAYLRVYEPLTSFPEPQRSRWAAYATMAKRGRQADVEVEHAAAVGRLIATPPVIVPDRESHDAYLRHVDGMVYVCPWQTRLRSWLALERLLRSLPAELSSTIVPPALADRTLAEFQRWKDRRRTLRVHILCNRWRVPPVWFVSFDPAERWLVLDNGRDRGPAGPTTATRGLVYVTELARASQRLSRAQRVICQDSTECLSRSGVENLRWWLTEFHPRSLVELDYGGLVHLLDDESLRTDQSVAETAAAITGLETGQHELTAAMYERLTDRWRSVEALQSAN